MTRPLVLACLLAAVGCSDVTPPDRPAPYPFSFTITGGLQVVFHWTRQSLPVRIWVEPVGELPDAAAEAIRVWEDVALYGEFEGLLVADSSRADVIIVRGDGRPIQADTNFLRLDCFGRTTVSIELDTTITLPFRITVGPRLGANVDGVNGCARVVVAHELGHALGLFLHSDDARDLMNASPSFFGPSARDRVTFTALYHTPPTIGLPAGR
jgi:predicted Zn-dependent protease